MSSQPKKTYPPGTKWKVKIELCGHGWMTVTATTAEEAKDIAWERYTEGDEVQEIEWKVPDVEAQLLEAQDDD